MYAYELMDVNMNAYESLNKRTVVKSKGMAYTLKDIIGRACEPMGCTGYSGTIATIWM